MMSPVRSNDYDFPRFVDFYAEHPTFVVGSVMVGKSTGSPLTAIKFRRHGKASDADLFVPANTDEEITEEAKAKAKAGPPPSDVYTIRATCKARGETWNESYDMQTGNNWLRRKIPN
jgi:hypothetical protein